MSKNWISEQDKLPLPVYLTYGQHNDEKNNEQFFYKYKLKSYNDGVCKVYEYKNERLKSTLSMSKTNHFSFSKNDLDLSEVEKELLLIEDRKKYLWKVKNKLRDYARNNDFDMFWTLTFDNNKIADVDDYRFDEMNKWLRKMRDTYGKFRYIAIPERHKSGAIHWHMVTGGFRPVLINSGKKYKNTPIHNCTDWEHGFSNVQKVRSKIKVANYISKYITKDLVNSPVRKGKKKYWTSQGLSLPSVEYGDKKIKGIDLGEPCYENDVLKIYEVDLNLFNELDKNEKEED